MFSAQADTAGAYEGPAILMQIVRYASHDNNLSEFGAAFYTASTHDVKKYPSRGLFDRSIRDGIHWIIPF